MTQLLQLFPDAFGNPRMSPLLEKREFTRSVRGRGKHLFRHDAAADFAVPASRIPVPHRAHKAARTAGSRSTSCPTRSASNTTAPSCCQLLGHQ